ncbi:MAG: hypothetical protein AVDCRST_MAG54-1324, partial [uncultured Actinomycetospora sp.]
EPRCVPGPDLGRNRPEPHAPHRPRLGVGRPPVPLRRLLPRAEGPRTVL